MTTAHKRKGPASANDRASTTKPRLNSEAVAEPPQSPAKAFATLQAAAALKGITLERIEGKAGPVYVVGRWGMSIAVGTLAQAQGLIQRMTGEAAK